MNVTGIFSALNNPSLLTPLAVKDTAVELIKADLAYDQGAKESEDMGKFERNERLLSGFVTSVVWLGGIPAFKKLCDHTLFKYFKVSPDVDYSLFKGTEHQSIEKNIARFKNTTSSELLEDLETIAKSKESKKLFKNLNVAKFVIATGMPVLFLGFVLPKMIYAFTKGAIEEQCRNGNIAECRKLHEPTPFGHNDDASFKGIASFLADPAKNTLLVDGAISGGRTVAATTRDGNEGIGTAIEELGFIGFMYLTMKPLQKWLEKMANKFLNLPIDLDNKILESDELKNIVKSGKKVEFNAKDEKEVLDFIVKNENSPIVKFAKETGLIKTVDGVIDPRQKIDTKGIIELKEQLDKFMKTAKAEGADKLNCFFKKAKYTKRGAIAANLAVSVLGAGYVVPKLRYLFREQTTESSASPGIMKYREEVINQYA